MAIVFAILAGMIIGGGLVGWQLSQRWKSQVESAKADMQQVLAQHQQEQEAAQDLKQKVADLEYQLNEANKDLNFYRNQ
ncbi:hypothetical protein [Bacterioplanoides sp.]|uniref:hypothetical protein n=1 Tax=Bacterioplanoides sp. TaxID=2066072 RepID=UPI003B0016D3